MYNTYLREDDAVGTRQSAVFVAYLKAGLFLAPSYQPFRHTYGMAVWLATPIMPLWGFGGMIADNHYSKCHA